MLDIVTANTYQLRGQAWVIFDSPEGASRALSGVQGFTFFGKPMNLAYAHKTSDIIARLRGEDVVRDPTIRQTRKAENQERERASKFKAEQIFNRSNSGPETVSSGRKHKKVICVQGLPDATTRHMLELLFQQFNGFQEAQVSGERPITGHVRFDSAGNAAIALQGLQGFRLNSTHALHLSLVDSH